MGHQTNTAEWDRANEDREKRETAWTAMLKVLREHNVEFRYDETDPVSRTYFLSNGWKLLKTTPPPGQGPLTQGVKK